MIIYDYFHDYRKKKFNINANKKICLKLACIDAALHLDE